MSRCILQLSEWTWSGTGEVTVNFFSARAEAVVRNNTDPRNFYGCEGARGCLGCTLICLALLLLHCAAQLASSFGGAAPSQREQPLALAQREQPLALAPIGFLSMPVATLQVVWEQLQRPPAKPDQAFRDWRPLLCPGG